jgi:hypothetical protein
MRALTTALALAACTPGNDLLPLGNRCEPMPRVSEATMKEIGLIGSPAYFDDLVLYETLGEPPFILAVPEDRGALFIIDTNSNGITRIDGLPRGVGSAAPIRGGFVLADRSGEALAVVSMASKTVVSTYALGTRPDYVRSFMDQVWVTEPRDDRIEVLDIDTEGTLTHVAYIDLSGSPEGLVFDPFSDVAFTHLPDGQLAAIGFESKTVHAVWDTGCGASHGIPAFNSFDAQVYAGCATKGGGVALSTQSGLPLAGFEVGSGEAVLAYGRESNSFYLRGDPGEDLAVLHACLGGMALNGIVKIPNEGHAMVAHGGSIFIADPALGGILRVSDPFVPR